MEAKLKMTDKERTKNNTDQKSRQQELPPAAVRALKEAEERRKQAHKAATQKEIGGRGGKDPSRYGDWEINGRAIDF